MYKIIMIIITTIMLPWKVTKKNFKTYLLVYTILVVYKRGNTGDDQDDLNEVISS